MPLPPSLRTRGRQGHYFHIDFGFCLGHSTGKQIGGLVECSPFKLTEEYIELLDGRGSPV